MSDDQETFLKRWSRRKRLEADTPARGDAGSAVPSEAPSTGAERLETSGVSRVETRDESDSADEPLDLDSLPKPEDLTPASDIKAFLDPRVPAALRNAALKRMWTLDPSIRDFIEVAENQWDWNTPGGAPGYEPLEDAKIVARLLDHAVSAITGADKQDSPILSSDVSPLRPPAPIDSAVHDETAAGGALEPMDKAVPVAFLPDSTCDAVPQNMEAGVKLAGAPRRRHGGALPE